MVWPLVAAAVSAGSNIIGGMMNRDAAEDASRRQAEQAELNRQMQLQFAKEGIRWKVDDAKAAGIHPLYALGANTVSYSPVSVGGSADTSMGSAIASSGQDISRAINATRTTGEREDAFTKTSQDLTLTKMGLENELLASQIAKLKANTNPPMPSVGPVPESSKFEDRPRLRIGGDEIQTDPKSANAEDFEKRYGELSDVVYGPALMWQDYVTTMGGAEHRSAANPYHVPRKGLRYLWDDMLRRQYERKN